MSHTQIGPTQYGVQVLYDRHDAENPYALDDGSTRIWMTRAQVDALIEHESPKSRPEPIVSASDITFNEGLMRLAAVHGKTVTFRYAKGDGTVIETRTLKPEHVLIAKDGHVTFTGYDPDRDEPRAYRTDRIKGEVTVG